MCGIVGVWGRSTGAIRTMTDQIRQRGPDSAGIWNDEAVGLAFGHRRLAILDLSDAGAQPMASHSGRYVIAYNGEIYNHLQIRNELQAGASIKWRGGSDTETLIEAISIWGIEKALNKINGMFAFSLWDGVKGKLYLARDRMGEKPLYWGKVNTDFVFASEVKAISAHPLWEGGVDRDVLALYLRHNYVPGPYSIHPNLFKLQPGHWIEISNGGRDISEPKPYWSIEEVIARRIANNTDYSEEESITKLDELLSNAVEQRMLSDVPLGAFLSGGYDSSLIVALMQARSNRPVRTFSIGFSEPRYDEAPHAKAIARHLGTEHTEFYVQEEDMLQCIPELPKIWDEPFSDASQIPTLIVSRLAKQSVSVALSGDGGDELFYGYSRYAIADRLWKVLRNVPTPARKKLGWLLKNAIVPIGDLRRGGGDRLERAAGILDRDSRENIYKALVSHFTDPSDIVLASTEAPSFFAASAKWPSLQDFREQMMFADQKTYLPDDILVKVDRSSMAVSLETRVPFLDHRVVEFAWGLPMESKYNNRQSKWILRELTHRYIPRDLMERPKMGFRVPMAAWLRGPLRGWCEDLLSQSHLRNEGIFDDVKVRRIWEDFLSGRRHCQAKLWNVLMFQAWLGTRP